MVPTYCIKGDFCLWSKQWLFVCFFDFVILLTQNGGFCNVSHEMQSLRESTEMAFPDSLWLQGIHQFMKLGNTINIVEQA